LALPDDPQAIALRSDASVLYLDTTESKSNTNAEGSCSWTYLPRSPRS
jgi:hypothetical protein